MREIIECEHCGLPHREDQCEYEVFEDEFDSEYEFNKEIDRQVDLERG